MILKNNKKLFTYAFLGVVLLSLCIVSILCSVQNKDPIAIESILLPEVSSQNGADWSWIYGVEFKVEEQQDETNTMEDIDTPEPELPQESNDIDNSYDVNRHFVTRGGSEHITPRDNLTHHLMGIDISHYQSDKVAINWDKVKKSGVSFVFTKISEGNNYRDPTASKHVSGAHEVEIPVGGYHFARPNQPIIADAQAEATFFIERLEATFGENQYGDLMAVLDLEAPYQVGEKGLTSEDLVAWAEAFCQYYENNTDNKIMIYTGNWFIERWENFFGLNNPLQKYPLWLADYYTNNISGGGWTTWTVWQFSDKGQIDGINGYVDLNIGPTDLTQLKP